MCTHTNIYTYMIRTQREGGLESRKMKAGEKKNRQQEWEGVQEGSEVNVIITHCINRLNY